MLTFYDVLRVHLSTEIDSKIFHPVPEGGPSKSLGNQIVVRKMFEMNGHSEKVLELSAFSLLLKLSNAKASNSNSR